jgi:hypothetical protein
VEDLYKSIQLEKDGGRSWQWFFLAMSHWQLGEKEEARQSYYQAVEWSKQKRWFGSELYRLRVEAAELLGIDAQPNGKEVTPEKNE